MGATDQPSVESLRNDSNEQVKKTAQEIHEIKNGANNQEKKVQLEGVLTKDFANTLKGNIATAKALYSALGDYTEGEDPGITELRNFLEPIVNPHKVEGTITSNEKPSTNAESVQKITTFDNFFGDNGPLKDIDKVTGLDTSIVTAIRNIKIALEYPTKENIKNLQEFLYNNLSTSEQQTFFNKNKADKSQQTYSKEKGANNWDGKMLSDTKVEGSTAEALNNFLTATANFVEKQKKHNEVTKTAEDFNKPITKLTSAIEDLDDENKITVQAIIDAQNKYNNLNSAQKAKIDKNLVTKLTNFKKEADDLTTKFTGMQNKILTIFNSICATGQQAISEQQAIYEFTKLFNEQKLTKREAKILLNEFPSKDKTTTENIGQEKLSASLEDIKDNPLYGSTENLVKIINYMRTSLENICNGVGTNPDTDPAKAQEEIRRNTEAQQSFDELTTGLQKLGDAKINHTLLYIKQLNDVLKQGHSIKYLNAEKERLEKEIENYIGADIVIDDETGKIKDKKNNIDKQYKKEINDLEKELMKVCIELNKKNETKGKITNYLNNIKENQEISGNDYYKGLIAKYENSLDLIGENQNTEAGPASTNPDKTHTDPETPSNPASQNTPRRSTVTLGAYLEKQGYKWDENKPFWTNVGNALGAVLSSIFGFKIKGKETTTESDATKIKLDGYNDQADVKTALEAINKIEKAFNGRKEIADAINLKNGDKIKHLQRKLWDFPQVVNGEEKQSDITISGKIDKTTAEALQKYAENAGEGKNNDPMPYTFCNGYEAIKTNIANTEIYKSKTENDDTYIMIKKDSSENIESITRGKLENSQTVPGETTTDEPKFNSEADTYTVDSTNNTVKKEKYIVPNPPQIPNPSSGQTTTTTTTST